MTRWLRRTALASAVVGLAAALLVVGSALGSPTGGGPPAPSAAPTARTDALSTSIAALQQQLARNPNNPRGWAGLGLAYVQKGRITFDPSYYPKAEGAISRSRQLQPARNDLALTGAATLAAARHDFAAAVRLADASLAVNSYSATTYGVKVDALTELGRYPDALVAMQRMLDLQPGVASFARLSYQYELRGNLPAARSALDRAAKDAFVPADKAFSYYYLGELGWNSGNLAEARRQYENGLRADPSYLPLVAGRARVEAASGNPRAALADYRTVTETLPAPQYLVEMGELLQATGQQAAAQQTYDVVRATQQLFMAAKVDVDVELAIFEADHGSPAEAVRLARAGYLKRPAAILAQDAYAWALHAAGRDREALPLTRQANRLGYRFPSLRYHRGVIEAAVGSKAVAVRELSAALALNPSFNPLQAPKARALLAQLR